MRGDRLDAYLGLIAERNRRVLLRELRDGSTGMARIDDLVDRLHEDGPATDRYSDREQFAVRLYHVHLPKLAEHGVVEYDLDKGTIEYQPDEQLEAVLDSLPDEVSVANP